jgi:signal transduction histidine kinase
VFTSSTFTLTGKTRDWLMHGAAALGMGLIYFLACYLALSIDVTNGAASVWPASGLLFGTLLLVSRRFIPSVLVGALVGGSAANLAVGFATVTSIGYTFINLGEGLAGCWLVRRLCPDAPRLSQPLNGFALIACGVAASVAGAFVAATLATLASHAHWFGVFGTWSGSDSTGVVIVTPAIVATASAVSELRRPLPRWRVVEALFLFAVLVMTSAWLYLLKHPSRLDQFTNPLLILPVIAWAAVRFEATGAAWSILIVNAFCIWGTALGYGPMFDLTPSSLVNLVIQARVGVTGMVALSLGAAVGAARRSAAVHRRLALELQAAGDRERSRLSHELHDEVAQKLAALKMQLQLSNIAPELDRRKSTASSVEIVNDLLTDVRAMSHSLRPAPFDEGQLLAALNALAKSEGTRGRLTVLVESPEHELPLPRNIELVCYRVVREAIANVVKHAQAQHVCVFVNHGSEQLTLSIVDDGRGFDVAPTTRQAVRDGHLGLVGMRERLTRVGGTLNVRSTLGQGTTITCLVPLGVAA